MGHCDSPGCTQKSTERASNNSGCGSPGCPGRAVCHARRKSESRPDPVRDRYTQSESRPADPVPDPGLKTRPTVKNKKPFCRVIITYRSADYVLAAVLYEDVQKFGGLKIMVFTIQNWDRLTDEDLVRIDPHFYPDDKSPSARFAADIIGLTLVANMLYLDPLGPDMTPFRAVIATTTACAASA